MIQPCKRLILFSQTRINNCDIVRSDVFVNRQFFEVSDDLLCLFCFARHRIGMSKTGPYFGCAPKRYRLIKGSNSLGESSLLVIRPAQKIVIKPIIWIEIDGGTQLLDRFVPLMREYINRTQIAIEPGREWIDLQSTLS